MQNLTLAPHSGEMDLCQCSTSPTLVPLAMADCTYEPLVSSVHRICCSQKEWALGIRHITMVAMQSCCCLGGLGRSSSQQGNQTLSSDLTLLKLRTEQ